MQELGRRTDTKVVFLPHRGKGSNGMLYFGDHRTVVRSPKDELKKGTLHAMLSQFGIDPADL